MDDGSLLVFLEPDGSWDQLVSDLEASGARCTQIRSLDGLEERLAGGDFGGVLTSNALVAQHPKLKDLGTILLIADDLKESPEPELIDPFATLGDRSVLRTLDRHLDRVETLISQLEERL
jgi:hypothetical protein